MLSDNAQSSPSVRLCRIEKIFVVRDRGGLFVCTCNRILFCSILVGTVNDLLTRSGPEGSTHFTKYVCFGPFGVFLYETGFLSVDQL